MLALMFIMRKFRYELWKPNLRSMMESDMKEVSVGNKSKADVLANCLQQMKACFLDVRLEFCQCLSLIKKLDHISCLYLVSPGQQINIIHYFNA